MSQFAAFLHHKDALLPLVTEVFPDRSLVAVGAALSLACPRPLLLFCAPCTPFPHLLHFPGSL